MTITIEDDDENQPTSGADEIRRAFAGVIGAILDTHRHSPACRRAVEEVLNAHERIRRIFETAQNGKSNGLTALWVGTGLR